MDSRQIFVEGIELVGHHGVFEEEKQKGVRFRIDLKVDVDHFPAFDNDQLTDTIDYRDLIQTVLTVAEGESLNLIENLAETMVDRLLSDFPVKQVEISLRKKSKHVAGNPDWVGVRIQRTQKNNLISE